jgi:integrase
MGRLGPKESTLTKKSNGNIRITRGVTLVPLPDGQWRCRVNVPGQGAAGRESKNYPDKGSAMAAGQAWKTKLEKHGTAAAVKVIMDHRSARFEEFAKQWLVEYEPNGIKATTRYSHQLNVRVHLIPQFGQRQIVSIEPAEIRAWIETKRRTLSNGTVKNMKGTLSLIFDKAIEEKICTFDPTATITLKSRVGKIEDLEDEEVKPFSVEEQGRILAAADKFYPDIHYGTALRIAFQSGMRKGELLALKAEDVDLEHATVTVSKTFSRGMLGTPKTGKKRVVQLGCPISIKSKEWRPQADVARDIVKRIRAIGRISGYLFGITPDKPANASNFEIHWKRTLAEAKVTYREPKTSRHTMASVLLSRGAEPIFVRRQGGWNSDQMITRTYGHWLDEGEKIRLGKVGVGASVQL